MKDARDRIEFTPLRPVDDGLVVWMDYMINVTTKMFGVGIQVVEDSSGTFEIRSGDQRVRVVNVSGLGECRDRFAAVAAEMEDL